MKAQPIFERENMGASPLAIARSLLLLGELKTTHPDLLPITLAAHIDASIRQSGAPELFESCTKLLDMWEFFSPPVDEWLQEKVSRTLFKAKQALAKATSETTP